MQMQMQEQQQQQNLCANFRLRTLVRFQIGGEGGFGEADGLGYGFGVEFGAFGAGVGVVFGEEWGGCGGAELFVGVGFEGAHVDELDVLLFGDLLDEGGVAEVAFDMRAAIGAGCPDVADGEGEDCRCGAFGLGFVDVFTEVPAVGVNGFGGSG